MESNRLQYFDQQDFDVKFEWGLAGIELLSDVSDVLIIVDVLSFSTSVDIAIGRGAIIFPFAGRGKEVENFAVGVDAQIAEIGRHGGGLSLSPASLLAINSGTRLVLPSPNGSTLSLAQTKIPVFTGCIRNAPAVAEAASKLSPRISVIAAGERWPENQSLRPAFEDLVGAGAIIDALDGSKSPEALSAQTAFRSARNDLDRLLRFCGSGRELIGMGFSEDVQLAAQFSVSDAAPFLINEAYLNSS